MLDVGDNLERAFEAVPQEALKGIGKDGQPLTAESAIVLLNGLVNGVRLTDKIFEQVSKVSEVQFALLPCSQTLDCKVPCTTRLTLDRHIPIWLRS